MLRIQFSPPCRWAIFVRPGLLGIAAVLFVSCSPSRFLARQILRAPNAYPDWVAPDALVTFAMPSALVTPFPVQSVAVGPPAAHLLFRVVEPADYQLREEHTTSERKGKTHYQFRYRGVPPPCAEWHAGPVRGTLLILHGYSIDSETMMPWALRLGADGWRSAVPDLRGHGQSTGDQVYFGKVETTDLQQLLDELEREGKLVPPLVVVGTSYGAALGLKLATEDPRVTGVVAMTPYARLETAVMGIRDGYASWVPERWVRGAARKLPGLVGVAPDGLDPVTWLAGSKPVVAWLAAGRADKIAPMADVQELQRLLAAGSEFYLAASGIHETIPLQIEELAPVVQRWLQSFPRQAANSSVANPR